MTLKLYQFFPYCQERCASSAWKGTAGSADRRASARRDEETAPGLRKTEKKSCLRQKMAGCIVDSRPHFCYIDDGKKDGFNGEMQAARERGNRPADSFVRPPEEPVRRNPGTGGRGPGCFHDGCRIPRSAGRTAEARLRRPGQTKEVVHEYSAVREAGAGHRGDPY